MITLLLLKSLLRFSILLISKEERLVIFLESIFSLSLNLAHLTVQASCYPVTSASSEMFVKNEKFASFFKQKTAFGAMNVMLMIKLLSFQKVLCHF